MIEYDADEPNPHPRFLLISMRTAVSFRRARFLLSATVWISAGLFGLYILGFYVISLFEGNLVRWNDILPGLYQKGSLASTAGIGLHFVTGAVILLLGNIQLIESLRDRYPVLHRWVGRIYILSSVMAASGGLVFIIFKGTVGGTVMEMGFTLYGLLMLLSGVQTYRYGVARRIDQHRQWGLRLYALAVGSWLYRMDYGFWFQLTGGVGHSSNFEGVFDQVMSFFFYVPNLLVAELLIRYRDYRASIRFRRLATMLIWIMTGFLVLGTYYFTRLYWGPAIIKLLSF